MFHWQPPGHTQPARPAPIPVSSPKRPYYHISRYIHSCFRRRNLSPITVGFIGKTEKLNLFLSQINRGQSRTVLRNRQMPLRYNVSKPIPGFNSDNPCSPLFWHDAASSFRSPRPLQDLFQNFHPRTLTFQQRGFIRLQCCKQISQAVGRKMLDNSSPLQTPGRNHQPHPPFAYTRNPARVATLRQGRTLPLQQINSLPNFLLRSFL